MIHAWVDKGLLFVVRTDSDSDHPTGREEHAVFNQDSVFWLKNGPNGEVQPLLDLEKEQILMGRAWPPAEPPISL